MRVSTLPDFARHHLQLWHLQGLQVTNPCAAIPIPLTAGISKDGMKKGLCVSSAHCVRSNGWERAHWIHGMKLSVTAPALRGSEGFAVGSGSAPAIRSARHQYNSLLDGLCCEAPAEPTCIREGTRTLSAG